MTERKRDEAGLPADRLWQPTTARWFAWVFGSALFYAVLRYHFAAAMPWRHFPLFILDKVTAVAAVLFVAASYLIGKVIRRYDDNPRLRLVVIKFCGLMGFFLATAHALMALLIMKPAYLAKYFLDDGMMNLRGELGMVLGVVALFFLLSPALTTLPMMPKALGGFRWKRSQRSGYIALTLVAVHLLVLGLGGWLAPDKWPWGLPPISLLAFGVALVPLAVRRRLTSQKQAKG